MPLSNAHHVITNHLHRKNPTTWEDPRSQVYEEVMNSDHIALHTEGQEKMLDILCPLPGPAHTRTRRKSGGILNQQTSTARTSAFHKQGTLCCKSSWGGSKENIQYECNPQYSLGWLKYLVLAERCHKWG